jgi:hypothetical protein
MATKFTYKRRLGGKWVLKNLKREKNFHTNGKVFKKNKIPFWKCCRLTNMHATHILGVGRHQAGIVHKEVGVHQRWAK